MYKIPLSSGITTSPPRPLYATSVCPSITNSFLTITRFDATRLDTLPPISTFNVIVALPSFNAVTTPSSFTVATFSFVEDQINL